MLKSLRSLRSIVGLSAFTLGFLSCPSEETSHLNLTSGIGTQQQKMSLAEIILAYDCSNDGCRYLVVKEGDTTKYFYNFNKSGGERLDLTARGNTSVYFATSSTSESIKAMAQGQVDFQTYLSRLTLSGISSKNE